MGGDENQRDQLNEAIDGLLSGRAVDHSDVPDSLRPLLAAAEQLSVGAGDRHGPRPSFVLGLESQLRTDLRLAGARPYAPVAARPWWRLLLAGAVGVGVLAVGTWRAEPTHPLYGARLRLEAGRAWLVTSTGARAALDLDRAWGRLEDLRTLSDTRARPAESRPVLASMVAAYDDAIDHAVQAGDARLLLRAVSEMRAARAELRRLAEGRRPVPDERSLRLAVDALTVLLARADGLTARRFGDGHAVVQALAARSAAGSVPEPAAAGPVEPSATARDAGSVAPPATASPFAAVATATEPVPSMPPAPIASPTDAPPSPQPTSAGDDPATSPPPPTSPRPIRPPATLPVTPTAVSGDPGIEPVVPGRTAPATATPDRWPVTTTPMPRPPTQDAPPPTPMPPPTEEPPAAPTPGPSSGAAGVPPARG